MDLDFIEDPQGQQYVAQLQTDCELQKIDFKIEFEETDPNLISILGPML